jgi:hypothetical protein
VEAYLLQISTNILNRCYNFCRKLNLNCFYIRQPEMHTASDHSQVNIGVSYFELLLKSWNDINFEVLIKFLQNWPELEVTYNILRSPWNRGEMLPSVSNLLEDTKEGYTVYTGIWCCRISVVMKWRNSAKNRRYFYVFYSNVFWQCTIAFFCFMCVETYHRCVYYS